MSARRGPRPEVVEMYAARTRGKRFGKLVAVELAGRKSGNGQVWVFRCDCGETVERCVDSVVFSLRTTKIAACPTCATLLRGGPKRSPRKGRHIAGCPVCSGLPHRRPVNGVCLCGLPYAADELEPIEHRAIARKAVSL